MCIIIIIIPHHNVMEAKITFDSGIFGGKAQNYFGPMTQKFKSPSLYFMSWGR